MASWEVPMKKSQSTDAQIIAILAESDAGKAAKDVGREHGIRPSPYP
jgi:hypothetical protein